MIRFSLLLISICSTGSYAASELCFNSGSGEEAGRNPIVDLFDRLDKGKLKPLVARFKAVSTSKSDNLIAMIELGDNKTTNITMKQGKAHLADTPEGELQYANQTFGSILVSEVRDPSFIEVTAYNEREGELGQVLEFRGRIRIKDQIPYLGVNEMNGVFANQTLEIQSLNIFFKSNHPSEETDGKTAGRAKFTWLLYDEDSGLNIGDSETSKTPAKEIKHFLSSDFVTPEIVHWKQYRKNK